MPAPQMDADRFREFFKGLWINKSLATIPKTICIHLRSSAFICG
ncbi:hypothetical protein [Ancylothrix sp. D3o]|nr:hypothetical protein [Ancylothrix sp. D3o]